MIILEKQYRYPFGKTIIEIPAGKLDSVLEGFDELTQSFSSDKFAVSS